MNKKKKMLKKDYIKKFIHRTISLKVSFYIFMADRVYTVVTLRRHWITFPNTWEGTMTGLFTIKEGVADPLRLRAPTVIKKI